MKKVHKIENLRFEDDEMILDIDGREYNFRLSEVSDRLKNADSSERERFEISPSGYGIHWPIIDEDLSIDGLLGITHEPTPKEQIAKTQS